MQHEDKKFIQHKIQYTVAQCGVGVGVSREKRPNEQKFKKGGGNLVFVLLCFNYNTIHIYMLVILPNVLYRCIYTMTEYIYILEKVKTHTCARTDTHNILYMHVLLQSCIPINMETYPQKTVLILPYFVHMHVSFQAKEVDAPKGEEQVFFKTQQGQHYGA